jgi:uncharacterized coiled-coil protein SlyX
MGSPYRIATPGGAPNKAISLDGPQRPTHAVYWRMIVATVTGAALIAGGGVAIWAAERSATVAPAPAVITASRLPSDDSSQATRALQATQQETIDQLQIVQDELAAQKIETKKLSDQIVDLTEKLEAVQSNLPAASSTSAVLASKSHH